MLLSTVYKPNVDHVNIKLTITADVPLHARQDCVSAESYPQH